MIQFIFCFSWNQRVHKKRLLLDITKYFGLFVCIKEASKYSGGKRVYSLRHNKNKLKNDRGTTGFLFRFF